MTKYLPSIFVSGLMFSVMASAPVEAEQTCLCFGRFFNGFNATAPQPDGRCARGQTGPFCFGIVVVTDEQSYTNFCGDNFDPSIDPEAVCPEREIVVAQDCEINPQIPQQGANVPRVFLSVGSPLTGIGGPNNAGPLPTSAVQSVQCFLSCQTLASPGITGTLTAVAFCAEP